MKSATTTEPHNGPTKRSRDVGKRRPAGTRSLGAEAQAPDAPAAALDPAVLERRLVRLRRIEGQVRGLQTMVRERRTPREIVTQALSVYEALRAFVREQVSDELKQCVSSSLRQSAGQRNQALDEFVSFLHRYRSSGMCGS